MMQRFLLLLLVLCAMFQAGRADFLKSGLDLVMGGDSANGQEGLMNQGLPFLFNMLSKTSFKEFPFEGGKLTNIEVQVIPPKSFDKVNVEVLSDTLFFQIGGLGAKIGADFELIIKNRPATGHLDIDITDLGVDLKLRNEPITQVNGDRKVGADIKLDLEHTHADIKLSTEGNVEEIKNYLIGLVTEEVKSNITPDWAQNLKFWTGTRAIGPMHYAMIKRTQDIVNQYYAQERSFETPIYLSNNAAFKVGNPQVLENFGDYMLDNLPQTEGIKNRLVRKGGDLFTQNKFSNRKTDLRNNLIHDAGHIDQHANLPKTEYFLTNKNYNQFFLKSDSDMPILNTDMVKKLLENNSGISQKVEEYFGGKVQFQCTPTNSEPVLKKGDGTSIIGTYTVKCIIQNNKSEEPVYSMELDLEFVIHPDNKKDGNPVERFGDYASTNVGMTEDGEMKVDFCFIIFIYGLF